MNISLTRDIEVALEEEARKQGTSAELLALDCLRKRFLRTTVSDNGGQGTLADFLKDYIGVISSGEKVPGGARMSEDMGRRFAEEMVEKRRRGKL